MKTKAFLLILALCVAGTAHATAVDCHEAANGTPCGGACVRAGSCQSGVCIATALVPDGASCATDDHCTVNDSCHAGICERGQDVVCPGIDECRIGVCRPAYGCGYKNICIAPANDGGAAGPGDGGAQGDGGSGGGSLGFDAGPNVVVSGPDAGPTVDPTVDPSVDPTVDPSVNPSVDPTVDPSADMSGPPSIDKLPRPSHDPGTGNDPGATDSPVQTDPSVAMDGGTVPPPTVRGSDLGSGCSMVPHGDVSSAFGGWLCLLALWRARRARRKPSTRS